jgi:hypothetical protein
MTERPTVAEDLEKEALARLVVDFFHRIAVHYGMWFAEVRHQMGPEKALDAMETAYRRSLYFQMKRLGKVLDFAVSDGLPAPLLDLPREKLIRLLDAVAANWLANDGVWFQAVEFDSGMNDAKRCNDTCWAHYSPFEARLISRFLNLPAEPGLDGLKRALNFRIYARINVQSFIDEGPDAFVFQMNECRVQTARKRKGLEDYACKSGGLVEYVSFARAIDPRIRTECVGCPPDAHPQQWYCAWRFSLPSS